MTLPMAEDPTNFPPPVRLGRIGVAVVLVCLLLDASLRFLPPRFIAFRAWEAVQATSPGHGRFIPNMIYRNPRSYGDLANIANLPRLRQYREEVFSIDAAGYRNRGEVKKPFTGILLLGDSFTAGSGVSDSLTLSEQLQEISGRRVYNGAPTSSLWELLQYLQMTRGLVVWQLSERIPLPLPPGTPAPSAPAATKLDWRLEIGRRAFGGERVEALRRGYLQLMEIEAYSPLRILFGRAVRSLQDDRIYPNPYRNWMVSSKLRNGREILFLSTDLESGMDRPTDPGFFVQLRTQLQERGIGLLILLVPDKYAVYQDLLLAASPATNRRRFLDAVEQRLAAASVPVLNMTTHFRKQAEALLARDEYLYWLDDSHWNGNGIRATAQAITGSQAFSECPCQ